MCINIWFFSQAFILALHYNFCLFVYFVDACASRTVAFTLQLTMIVWACYIMNNLFI